MTSTGSGFPRSLLTRAALVAVAGLLATPYALSAQESPAHPTAPDTSVADSTRSTATGANVDGAVRVRVPGPGESVGDTSHIPIITRRELLAIGGLTGVTFALLPLDKQITMELREPAKQESRAWDRTMTTADLFGAGVAQYSGPAMIIVGRIVDRPGLTDAGVHVTQSVVAASAVGFVAKGLAGRRRPYWPKWISAGDFKLGRGFPHEETFSSFPAGHAIGVWAFAGAMTIELRRWQPDAAPIVVPIMYGAALVDAVSRVYRDTHWPSDIAAAAVLGTAAGLVITRHQHARPGNRLDRLMGSLVVAPTADGALAVGLQRSF